MSNRYFEDKEHVSLYQESRPVYSREIYQAIVDYMHEKLPTSGLYPLAVDVGCGTGKQSTYQLLDYFQKVIGCDVSTEMIKAAQGHLTPSNRISFVESPAENLPVEDNSTSLVLAATSLHWFDWPRFYAEVDRVLVPNGVVACMTFYKYGRVFHHPNSTEISTIMKEVYDRPRQREFRKPGNELALDKYVAESLQIPYGDKIRRDDLATRVTCSLAQLLAETQTSSVIRRMFAAEPKRSDTWWDGLIKRLMSAVGTDSLDTKIEYSNPVILLLGRKPGQNHTISSTEHPVQTS